MTEGVEVITREQLQAKADRLAREVFGLTWDQVVSMYRNDELDGHPAEPGVAGLLYLLGEEY